jgi:hypothetical protein
MKSIESIGSMKSAKRLNDAEGEGYEDDYGKGQTYGHDYGYGQDYGYHYGKEKSKRGNAKPSVG